ncbi:hypothetical protein GCM10025787_11410 [Saccharopolyspora rosea]
MLLSSLHAEGSVVPNAAFRRIRVGVMRAQSTTIGSGLPPVGIPTSRNPTGNQAHPPSGVISAMLTAGTIILMSHGMRNRIPRVRRGGCAMTQTVVLLVMAVVALGGLCWTIWDVRSDLRRRK